MRYVQTNIISNASTGAVMHDACAEREALGDAYWLLWGRGRKGDGDHELNFVSMADVYADATITRLDGCAGFHFKVATKQLLAALDAIDPDIVHLHNLHGYYVNIEMLFSWLVGHRCEVRWTLHDRWAFTGHCLHFERAGCTQWKRRCGIRGPFPLLHHYPKTYVGRSVMCNFDDKKRIFTSVLPERMTLYTPLQWLAGLVEQSFLSCYPIIVRPNTVDTNVFKTTPSDFRAWHRRGLLRARRGECLDRREEVLGLPPARRRARFRTLSRGNHRGLTRRQMRACEGMLVALPRTESQRELAQAYTAAGAFFNPSIEDTFPTVTLEAQACGTPIVVYDRCWMREMVRRDDSLVVAGYVEGAVALRTMEAACSGREVDEEKQ